MDPCCGDAFAGAARILNSQSERTCILSWLVSGSCYRDPFMNFSTRTFALLTAAALGSIVAAQEFKPKPPTAADWAALARLPDFTGVWETAPGGGGGGRTAGAAGAGG